MADPTAAGIFTGVAPMFLTDDVERTAEWYRDHLGFFINDYFRSDHGATDDPDDPHNEHHPGAGEALFVIIEREGHRIMFGRTESPGLGVHSALDAKAYACDAYFWLDGVETYWQAVKATGVDFLEDYVVQPYGLAEFRILDCDRRVLTFGGPPA
ncbi:MAG: VOC family protein [bacterium]